MKRVVLAAALAAGILLSSPSGAAAWAAYCDWDPLVLIVTPGGHVVPVYESVWTSNPLQIGIPLGSYTASRVYDSLHRPLTAVDVSITVPTGLLLNFVTRNMVTSGPLGTGKVYAVRDGTSGRPVHLTFTLPIS